MTGSWHMHASVFLSNPNLSTAHWQFCAALGPATKSS
jgi:hypothetical protein